MSNSNSSGSRQTVDLSQESPKKSGKEEKKGEKRKKPPTDEEGGGKKPKKSGKDKPKKGKGKGGLGGAENPVGPQLEKKAEPLAESKRKTPAGYGEIVRQAAETNLCPSCWMCLNEFCGHEKISDDLWLNRHLLDGMWDATSQVKCWSCGTKVPRIVVPAARPSGVVPVPDVWIT